MSTVLRLFAASIQIAAESFGMQTAPSLLRMSVSIQAAAQEQVLHSFVMRAQGLSIPHAVMQFALSCLNVARTNGIKLAWRSRINGASLILIGISHVLALVSRFITILVAQISRVRVRFVSLMHFAVLQHGTRDVYRLHEACAVVCPAAEMLAMDHALFHMILLIAIIHSVAQRYALKIQLVAHWVGMDIA